MSETENIIMSVEKHPCIWNIVNEDYYNREVKDLAWNQVCQEVFDDWETCADKADKCADLKKKWANIRDYYRKEMQKRKKVPSGSAARTSKTYIYSGLLHFLTPIFAARESGGNYPKEDTDSSQSQMQAENEAETNQPEDSNDTESPVPTSCVLNRKRKKDVPTQILNMLQQRQKRNAPSTDTNFLLSFRSHMKKMNHHQKIDFQLGMLQLVKKVIAGNDPSASQSRHMYSESSSGSLSSPHSVSSPSNYTIASPSPTSFPCVQRSPIYFKSPSPSTPSLHLSAQPKKIPLMRTFKPNILLRSMTNVTPPLSTTQPHPTQDYPQYSIPKISVADSETAQFLMVECEDSNEEDKYLQLEIAKMCI